MGLLDDYKFQCVKMERDVIPDAEGGYNSAWRNGVMFDAVIALESAQEATEADKNKAKSRYTVLTKDGVVLNYGDVFKRLSDGKAFCVVSNGCDKVAPARASFRFSNVTAEEYILAGGAK